METTTKQISVTKLTASEGMTITNKADVDLKFRTFAKVVVLAVNDSADNYIEITDAEAQAMKDKLKAIFDAEMSEGEARANQEPTDEVTPTEEETMSNN